MDLNKFLYRHGCRVRGTFRTPFYICVLLVFTFFYSIHVLTSSKKVRQFSIIVSSSSEETRDDSGVPKPKWLPRRTTRRLTIKVEDSKVPYEHAVHLMPNLIKHMRWTKGDTVLDYGCNDGNTGYHAILPHVIKWKGHLYGVDLAQRSVDQARAKFSHPLITYGRGSLTHGNSTFSDFPWPELRFDKIFAIYMLHFVHDMPPVLARFHEALKPGGQFGFISLTVQSWAFSVLMDLYRIEKWRKYMPDFEAKYYPEWSKFKSSSEGQRKLTDYLEKANFEVKFLKIEEWTAIGTNAAFYIDSFNLLSPSLQDIPKTELPALRNDVAKFFTKHTGFARDARNVNISYQYVMGVGKKLYNFRTLV